MGTHPDRFAFERLLAGLTLRLANVPGGRVVAAIEGGLRQLLAYLGCDRCTYSEFAADGSLQIVCSTAADGFEPLPRGKFAAVTWLVGEIRAGRTVALPELPQGLPAQAIAELAFVLRDGLRSHLSIPLRIDARVAGALSFGDMRSPRAWPEDLITRLTIAGEIIAGAAARARAEEEKRQLRMRVWHADRVARSGAIAAAIAHELNQPLTAILSNAQAGLRYLERGILQPDEVRAILQAVVRDDKRAAETIRSMRALLRRDEGGRAPVDLAAAVREVLRLLAGEFGQQGISVDTRLEPDCWALANKMQIEQVVLNLLQNAAAAMQARPRNERLLRVSVCRGDRRVVVSACDTGSGIAAEHLDTIFEPFWTTRKDGLGFGLTICRSIVEAHGGAIRVEPNQDRGVTVRFDLAGCEARENQQQPGSEFPPGMRNAALPAATPEPAVCVVDDDGAVRRSLVRVLTAAGWTVASCASAGEFLERPLLARIPCVVLDHHMPGGMSGIGLQKRLASQAGAPQVVFLTGHGDVETGVEAMKLGATDFLVKPVNAEALIAAVRKALERHANEGQCLLELEASRERVRTLSSREREVAAHVIRGRLNKQIAADLGIAEPTVKQHRGRVMEKMKVGSIAELVRVCEESGFFAAPVVAGANQCAHSRTGKSGRLR